MDFFLGGGRGNEVKRVFMSAINKLIFNQSDHFHTLKISKPAMSSTPMKKFFLDLVSKVLLTRETSQRNILSYMHLLRAPMEYLTYGGQEGEWGRWRESGRWRGGGREVERRWRGGGAGEYEK